MVGGAQQAEVAATVAVGPQLGLVVAAAEKPVGPEMDDQPGVLLRPPAVLSLVVAGQEAAPADGETGGEDGVDPEDLAGPAHVALRGGGDDDHMVPLALVPLQAQPGVLAEVAGQMALGERPERSSTARSGRPPSRRVKSFSLAASAAEPPSTAERSNAGASATTARHTGQKPRTATRKGRTLPPLVSVPSKSNAATVLGPAGGWRRARHPAPGGWSWAYRRVRQRWRRPARPLRRSAAPLGASLRCR